mmetsp:Transcript_12415/g.45251  ORF Transcript_12415/g.45251 Transcript_12415/m.45251 type:complete len:317 (+) Transcript_12415:289-1239(+)
MQKSLATSSLSLQDYSYGSKPTNQDKQDSVRCASAAQHSRLLRTPTKKRRRELTDSWATPDAKPRASVYPLSDFRSAGYDNGLGDLKQKAIRASSTFSSTFAQLDYGGSGNNGGGWGSPPRRRVKFWDEDESGDEFGRKRITEQVEVEHSFKNYFNLFCDLLQTGLISGLSLVLGDIISCLLRHMQIDFRRCMCLLAFGIFAAGPLQFLFYSAMEVLIPGKGALDIVKKMMCDQGLHSPLYNFNFLTLGALLDGHSVQSALFFASNGVLGLWIASVKIWPMLHVINFKFVPPAMRIVFINSMNVIWLTAATMMSGA